MSETGEAKSKPKQEPVSTKQKIQQGILAAGLAFGAGQAAAKPGENYNQVVQGVHRSIEAVQDPLGASRDLVVAANNLGARAIIGVEDSIYDDKPQKVEAVKSVNVETDGGIIHSEYGDVTPQQLELIDIAIGQEKDNLDSTMTDEDWANVFKYEGLIKEVGGEYGLDDDFIGLIIMESHADPYAESPAGAAGFGQLMPKFAEHYGLKVVWDDDPAIAGMTEDEIKEYRIKNDERYNGRKNLVATATSLKENIEKFKNKKIAELVHHDGDGRVWGALKKAIYDKYGYNLPDLFDESLSTQVAGDRLQEYQDTIEGKNKNLPEAGPIGLVDLLKTGEFNGEGSDGGARYMYLIDGAKLDLNEKKVGLEKITAGN